MTIFNNYTTFEYICIILLSKVNRLKGCVMNYFKIALIGCFLTLSVQGVKAMQKSPYGWAMQKSPEYNAKQIVEGLKKCTQMVKKSAEDYAVLAAQEIRGFYNEPGKTIDIKTVNPGNTEYIYNFFNHLRTMANNTEFLLTVNMKPLEKLVFDKYPVRMRTKKVFPHALELGIGALACIGIGWVANSFWHKA